MPKASRICCVPGCNSSSLNAKTSAVPLKFYRFPNDGIYTSWRKEKRKQWIDAVGIKKWNLLLPSSQWYNCCFMLFSKDGSPWQPTKNTSICSAHFVGGEKSENPLGSSYLPTIFPISYGTLNNSKSSERIVRILNRRPSIVTTMAQTDPSLASNPADTDKSNKSKADIPCTPDVVMRKVSSSRSQLVPSSQTCSFRTVKPLTTSIECQTNIPQDKQHAGMNCFICIMRVENNICTAEVQANIVSTVDRAVECNVSRDMMNRRDVACGPSVFDRQELQIVGFRGISSIRNDAELTDFCGVTFPTFDLLLSLLPNMPGKKLSAKNKLLMFLMKLKMGLTYSALAVLFNVHRSTVSRTFLELVQCLPNLLEEHVYWPTRETVQKTLPQIFKTKYPNCRVIIDCTEIRVEAPSTAEQKESMYSTYKGVFTIKFLLACTPNGFVCFKSKCYNGRTNDVSIVKDSEFLGFIESGDVILANKDFPTIKTDVEKKDAVFDTQFSSPEVGQTRKVASLRIHIKRCIHRIKVFRILSFLSTDMLPYADSIIHICCSLVNLQLPMSQSK